jgi:hypothetical protein
VQRTLSRRLERVTGTGAFWLDVSGHPLHVMMFPPRYTYAELDAQFDRFKKHYVTMVKERPLDEFALLVDISRVETSEARNRKRIALAMEELAELMKTRCVAQAYVVERPLIRAALTAVMWLRTAPWPVSVFGSRGDAEPWLRERMRARPSRRPETSG